MEQNKIRRNKAKQKIVSLHYALIVWTVFDIQVKSQHRLFCLKKFCLFLGSATALDSLEFSIFPQLTRPAQAYLSCFDIQAQSKLLYSSSLHSLQVDFLPSQFHSLLIYSMLFYFVLFFSIEYYSTLPFIVHYYFIFHSFLLRHITFYFTRPNMTAIYSTQL